MCFSLYVAYVVYVAYVAYVSYVAYVASRSAKMKFFFLCRGVPLFEVS